MIDYFRWRQYDANRCALNGWCYWTLRKSGMSVKDATAALEGTSVSEKTDLLSRHGVRFSEVPLWQQHGIGLYVEEYEKEGYNPIEDRRVRALRRRTRMEESLPVGEEYGRMIRKLMRRPSPLPPPVQASTPNG